MKAFGLATLFAAAANAASWTSTPFNPPAIPLAVRTPYFSTWLPQKAGVALNDAWPTFWTGSILGWAGFVKVDGTAYSFLGNPTVSGSSFTKANQTSFEFTTTQSIFKLTAGPVDLTVTFFSPVEPTDYVKQSIPFSYFTVSAASNDGGSHSVQVYSDISAEWVSGDNSLVVNWSTGTNDVLTHKVQLAAPADYTEISDHIQQGSAYYSTSAGDGVTYQTGGDVTVRAKFIADGALANTQDTNFRAINDNWPVLAFAHDLGSVSGTASNPVVISVGHIRDPVIQYITTSGMQARSIYAWSQYSTADDMISAFLSDYSSALERANAFDDKVKSDASAISANYAGIVSLSIRQALAAYEITISKGSDGSWNTSDVLSFQKEISSNGNMNTVDVIFPAWPVWLYLNPDLGLSVVEPTLRYQASGLYPNKWSIHDIGAHYPNATGHNDGGDEAMPVEESGNILIIALSHALKTGDNSFISRYWPLLDQFTQYLIEDSLIPGEQLSTDDFAGTLVNQTNLAIKGIVGIGAAAKIASLLGDEAKSSNYSSIATSYVSQFQNLAKSTTENHLTLHYNNNTSWGLTYNLFGDKLLGLNLFPDSLYESQTAWYKTKVGNYGVPLDTRHTYTKSDWQIWTAAIATDTEARDLFIDSVYKTASDGQNDGESFLSSLLAPHADDFYQCHSLTGIETTNGVTAGFRARPVVGGHLALLDL